MNDLELLLNNPLWVWVALAGFVFGILFAAILNISALQEKVIFKVYKRQVMINDDLHSRNKALKEENKNLKIQVNTAQEQIFYLQERENIGNLQASIQEIREAKHE